MAVAEQSKIFSNFTGGLNTEATPLNFPENAAQVLDNFDLHKSGKISRRLGLDFETNYTVRPETISQADFYRVAMNTSEWKAVNGKGDINFQVVQVGMTLSFFDLGAEPMSGSLRGSVDLTTYKTRSDAQNFVIDTSFGQGLMICTNPGMEPVYIKFRESDETFQVTQIEIAIRDFKGIDEGTAIDLQPDELTAAHEYNLRNQGWPYVTTVNLSRGGSQGVAKDVDPLIYTKNLLGRYPSNADQFYTARAVAAKSGKEETIGAYSPFHLNDIQVGNTPAPRGKYILEYFNQDRTGQSSIPGVSGVIPEPRPKTNSGRVFYERTGPSPLGNNPQTFTQTTDARPSCTAFYAGRAWYAGVDGTDYTGDVLFSQLIVSDDNIGRCYQEQDPTAEDINLLVPTDGGRVHVSDMGKVYRMLVIGQDLVLTAANGVWAISGSQGANFKADDFTVRRLSDQGGVNRDTAVLAEGQVFWWSRGGIWRMTSGQISDQFQVERITKDTIQTYYDEIGSAARAYARAYYDEFNKRIYWMYNDAADYDGINLRFHYNRILVLDLALPAFYTYTIGELAANSPIVSGLCLKNPGTSDIETFDVVFGVDDVVLSTDDIVQDVAFEQFSEDKIKVLSFVENEDETWSYTFSEFNDRRFRDWATWDAFINLDQDPGAEYTSVIQSGWQDYSAPLQVKHITHLTSFFERTETGYVDLGDDVVGFDYPSGGTVQVRWEWSDENVGRWTTPEVAYRLNRFYIPADALDPFTYGFELVKTKLRMRGKGASFSVRYVSEDGKDMRLYGFGINVRAGAKL